MLRRSPAFTLFMATLMLAAIGCGFSFTLDPEVTATGSVPPASISDQPTASALPSPTILPMDTASITLPPPTTTTIPPTTAPGRVTPGSPSGPYAVILVPAGDVLNIRSAAGVNNPVVGSYAPAVRNVMRTGPSARVGDALWVEVQSPGGTGWVNSRFLTEYVPPAAFCADAQVTALLNSLGSALLNSNGGELANLSSPAHGLDLRLWRYGTLVNYDRGHAKFLFESTFQVDWGPAPGSGENTLGSFAQAVLPRLTEVFGAGYQLHCNDTLDLATFSLEPWPPEYASLNFYAVHKPGTETYGGLDWRTWLAGIEYVSGKPYLFSLIHFQWEP